MPKQLSDVQLLPGQSVRVVRGPGLRIGYDKARTYMTVTAPGTYTDPIPPPVITPLPKVAVVSSIPDMLRYLADDSVDEVGVVGGNYPNPKGLRIGAAFAGRKRPIVVKPLTAGAVAFDGQGVAGSTWLTFLEGAHHQTWQGFRAINMRPSGTGLIVFGGDPTLVPPHDLVMRDIGVDTTNHRTSNLSNQEHTYYFAAAKGDGPHDILIDNPFIDGTDSPGVYGLWSGVHMDHGDAAAPASHNVTVRNLVTRGLNFPIILWTPPTHDWLFDGADIRDARQFAVRVESRPVQNIVLRNVVSVRSGGLYGATPPPGVTLPGSSLS